MSKMPIKKSSSGRSIQLNHGAPAPGPMHTPPQMQKGMGGNDAPPNSTPSVAASGHSHMPVTKPSSGRGPTKSPKMAAAGKKEPPPASGGGKTMPGKPGDSAQPVTAPVVPEVHGGEPSTGNDMAAMGIPGAQGPAVDMGAVGLPPELAALMQPNAQMAPQTQKMSIADLIRRMMMMSGQAPSPQELQAFLK